MLAGSRSVTFSDFSRGVEALRQTTSETGMCLDVLCPTTGSTENMSQSWHLRVCNKLRPLEQGWPMDYREGTFPPEHQ